MSGSLRIGRIGGIEIDANWTWLVVLALFAWSLAGGVFPASNPGLSPATYVVMGVAAALLLFGSIVLHELGHAGQARRDGMEVGGVTLWALGGVTRFTGIFPSAGAELRVALAGPAVSLALGVVFVGLAAILRSVSAVDGVVAWLGYVNLLLLVFNLIPALPMDGGRVLRALLWRARGDLAWATSVAAGIGFVLGCAMVVVGLVGGLSGAPGALWLAFIGVFVMAAGRVEAQTVAMRTAFAGLRVRDVMTGSATGGPPPAGMPQVDAEADLATTIAALLQAGTSVAAVVGAGEHLGFLDAGAVLSHARRARPAGLARS